MKKLTVRQAIALNTSDFVEFVDALNKDKKLLDLYSDDELAQLLAEINRRTSDLFNALTFNTSDTVH